MPTNYKNKAVSNIMQRVIYTSVNDKPSKELLDLTSKPLMLIQSELENYAKIDNRLYGAIYKMDMNDIGELSITFDTNKPNIELALKTAIYNIFRKVSTIDNIKIEIPKAMDIGKKTIDSYLIHPVKFNKVNPICYLMVFKESDSIILKTYNPIPKNNSLFTYRELTYLLKLGMSANVTSVVVDYDRIQYNAFSLANLKKAEREVKAMIEWMSLSTIKIKFVILDSDSLKRNNMIVVQRHTIK